MKNKLLASLLASQLVMTSIYVIQQPETAQAVETTTFPVVKINSNVTVDTTATVDALKKIHGQLPIYVQGLVKNIEIYQAADGFYASSSGSTVYINQQYIKNPVDIESLRGLYYHEVGHVIDASSYFEAATGSNLFDGKQELGRYNFSTGSNFDSASHRISSPGYRTTNLIPVTPGTRYLLSAENGSNGWVQFYDANKNLTRYASNSNTSVLIQSNEKYMTSYTVLSDLTLNKFKLYNFAGYMSLSRTNEFAETLKKMNYPVNSYYLNPQEGFADMIGIYLKYRAGAITMADLNAKNQGFLVTYFDPIEKRNFKVDPAIAKPVQDMPNPVQ